MTYFQMSGAAPFKGPNICHNAPEIALAILRRRHARLSANSHRLPMPSYEIHGRHWREMIFAWSMIFPGAREESVTETPRKGITK